jgi:hypothetical protein
LKSVQTNGLFARFSFTLVFLIRGLGKIHRKNPGCATFYRLAQLQCSLRKGKVSRAELKQQQRQCRDLVDVYVK